jgi:chromosome segregation ATPase
VLVVLSAQAIEGVASITCKSETRSTHHDNMSDYAKFVRAVASSTRDSAMDDLLEENRILQERNVNLEERNGRLDAELVSAQQDARALQQRLVLSASALQQQTDRLESLESAVDNVQAQVTTKNIQIWSMNSGPSKRNSIISSMKSATRI